jgi:hypothetical protein
MAMAAQQALMREHKAYLLFVILVHSAALAEQ